MDPDFLPYLKITKFTRLMEIRINKNLVLKNKTAL